MRWVAICLLALLTGCATTREITISAQPPDAGLTIDGVDRGPGPLIEKFTFNSSDAVHHVTAAPLGYAPQTVDLTPGYQASHLLLTLPQHHPPTTPHTTP